jgi:hypothetical protein
MNLLFRILESSRPTHPWSPVLLLGTSTDIVEDFKPKTGQEPKNNLDALV